MQYRFAEFDLSDKTATEARHHRAHLLLSGLVFYNRRDVIASLTNLLTEIWVFKLLTS